MKLTDRFKNILGRTEYKSSPIYLRPGDTIHLWYHNEGGSREILRETVDREYTITEAIAFAIDDDDYRGIGGAFLEKK